MSDSKIPAVGMHYDVSFAEYCEWDAMNFSTLKWRGKSRRHLKAAIEGRMSRRSRDFDLGRAIHARLLEPERYHDEYLIATPCAAMVKSGPNIGNQCGSFASWYGGGKWFCGTHRPAGSVEPEQFVTEDQRDRIEGIYEQCRSKSVINLMRAEGGVEVSAAAELMGVLCKVRADKDSPMFRHFPATLDVKKVTLGRGSSFRFSKSIEEYHYDAQLALYIDVLEAVDGIKRRGVWLVVEDSYPFATNVIRMDEQTEEIGRYKYQSWLMDYKHCLDTGVWSSYEDDIHDGGHSPSNLRRYKRMMAENPLEW